MTDPIDKVAAVEEVAVLDKLSKGVGAKLREFLWEFGPIGGDVDVGLLNIRHEMRKGYEELAHHVYGRSSLGRVTDIDGNFKRNFVFRLTQANVSFLDDGCQVIPRNSPRASELITAEPGSEIEISIRNGFEYLEVDQVRTFDGAVGLLVPGRKPDFRRMTICQRNQAKPVVVEYLRAATQENACIEAEEGTQHLRADGDPTWLTDWSGVYLASAEIMSLGHEFFTRTTSAQECALNVPRGLTFVEGVAGAGKTSVALGRLKFFANFATGEHVNDYGLGAAPLEDFSAAGMMGYVLSHSLKRYLRDTANALDLQRLPIKDFDEFRLGLVAEYGLKTAFRSRKAPTPPVRTRVTWIYAVDATAACVAADRFRSLATRAPNISENLREHLLRFTERLRLSKPSGGNLHLDALATKVVQFVRSVELDEIEAEIAKQFDVAMRGESRRDVERRERAMSAALARAQKAFEKRPLSPFINSLLASLRADQLYIAAVSTPDFPSFVKEAFETSSSVTSEELLAVGDAVSSLQLLLAEKDEDGRPSLTEGDLLTVIAVGGLVANGFEQTGVAGSGLKHLYDMRRHTAVFIDEVQDFNDVQIFLMGMSANGAYNQITLSGDRFQQLHATGAQEYAPLFPFVPRAQINKQVVLDVNFRQREALAALSEGFRKELQGDERVKPARFEPAVLHTFEDRQQMAKRIFKRIKAVPELATAAVICAGKADARLWFELLEEDLGSEHRPPLISVRDSLTRRFDIHFTDALEAKGLEFDVVVVPDVGAFKLSDALGRNHLYVALSRAKHSLFVGCHDAAIQSEGVAKLIASGLMVSQPAA